MFVIGGVFEFYGFLSNITNQSFNLRVYETALRKASNIGLALASRILRKKKNHGSFQFNRGKQ